MMPRLPPREWVAVLAWLFLAIVIWNGLYDLLLNRAAKDYLFRAALHEAGRGPAVSLSYEMGVAVRYSMWIATLWAAIILVAGLLTLRARRGVRAENAHSDLRLEQDGRGAAPRAGAAGR